MFDDRANAATMLLAKLPVLDPGKTVVVALPRGGVPIGAIIADALGAPLDIALVRKVGLPGQRELALAAVTDGTEPRLSINRSVASYAGLTESQIWELAKPELAEIDRRRDRYLGGRPPLPVRGKTVLVVDDGIATGTTMRAALEFLRAQEPAKVIVAVPVAAEDSLEGLDADQIVCLKTPDPFIAVGVHYRYFDQVSDDTVVRLLSAHIASGQAGRQGVN